MDKPALAPCRTLPPTTDDLRRLIQQLREADGGTGLLNSPATTSGEPLLSSLEKRVEEGKIGYKEIASGIRGICKHTIWANFCGNRPLAIHADKLLDQVNDAVRYMERNDIHVTRRHPTKRQSSGAPSTSAHSGPLGPVNELLKPTFNPALLKLKSKGGDTRALLLVADKELKALQKNGRTHYKPDNVGYTPPKETRKASGSRPNGGKKRRRSQSELCDMPFDEVFQKLLAGALGTGLGEASQSHGAAQALANMPAELVKMSEACGKEIARKQVTDVVKENGIEVSGICDALCSAAFDSLEAAIVHCSSDVMSQWETFKKSESSKRLKSSPTRGVRLSKIKSACEHFLEAVHTCAEELLESYKRFHEKHGGDAGWASQVVDDFSSPLPPSIEKNMEAYFQGQWKQAPFEHRAYERLTSFEVCEDGEAMFRRLLTESLDGCSPEFRANHEKHLKDTLPTIEKFLIQAVSERKTLELGRDIVEADTWGIDCYTRKNVHDAILEADRFEGTVDMNREKIEQKVAKWVEMVLMPAINKQGTKGWDMHCALDSIIEAQASSFNTGAAVLIKQRLNLVGYNYFRIHPKGQGVLCLRPEGIRPFTFVEEYLGVLHSPWRWFEIQDTLKRFNGDDLPDFYNIVLERPKKDPAGYDVIFIDAASKGSVASRMSHSCNPNCQAVVVSCKGRLTIAVYTTRRIEAGEELTFDYSSVTESEKEYRAAVCLCGMKSCRGSFLFFTGSNAFMEVMNNQHTFLHRNMLLLRACTESLSESDKIRLEANGIKNAALGTTSIDRVPEWLEKWVALCLEYVEMERELLPKELMVVPHHVTQCTLEQAEAQAKGVSENRIQNIVITLDKIRLALRQPSQPETPPLMLLSEEDVVDYLWEGDRSVAKRAVRAILNVVLTAPYFQPLMLLRKAHVEHFVCEHGKRFPFAAQICTLILESVQDLKSCQLKLLELESILRKEDVRTGGGHTACADVLHLYARTRIHFSPDKNYRGFSSEPLEVSLQSLSGFNLKGGLPCALTNQSGEQYQSLGTPDSCTVKRGRKSGGKDNILLSKKYSSHFIWGQLVVWFKQTVNDPAASLSADRRGTLSLPDIESCYASGRAKYHAKDRAALLDHIEKRPDGMWKLGTLFSFKNEAKVYGSPMFDSVWFGKPEGMQDSLQKVVQELRTSPLPVVAGSKKQSSNRGKKT